jgi:hypothetical protein
VPGRDDDDDDGPMSPRALRSAARDFDDPTTEDEGEKATKIVDARPLLEQLKKLAERDPDDEETQPKSRLARAALRALNKKGKAEAGRAKVDEPTPTVGAILVPATIVDINEDYPSIEIEELSLTEEEAALLAEEPLDPAAEADELLSTIRECLEAGDVMGALRAGESLLEKDPAHEAGLRYMASARQDANKLFTDRLGGLSKIPCAQTGVEDLSSFDHKAAFVLSLVDGTMTIEEILDVAAMPPFDALRILYELAEDGVIVTRAPIPSRRP